MQAGSRARRLFLPVQPYDLATVISTCTLKFWIMPGFGYTGPTDDELAETPALPLRRVRSRRGKRRATQASETYRFWTSLNPLPRPTIVDVRHGLQALLPWTILPAAANNWRGVMARKYIDCREFPNDAKCTLAISGTEREVLDAAVMHAVSVHGHEDAPELRETLRGMLKDTPETRAPATA
jgi:hypothetical protein